MRVKIPRFSLVWTILCISSLVLFPTAILAHGSEDHGDQKPQTAVSTKGTIIYTTRLGEIEVTLKHPEIVPDNSTSGKLFLTRFGTNAPIDSATAVIEIEGVDGSITQAVTEKTDDAGIFSVRIPALPQGNYVVRANITTKGETDAATFPGVEIRPESTRSASVGGYTWLRNALIGTILLVVIALFGVLIYFVLRFSASDAIDKEPVGLTR